MKALQRRGQVEVGFDQVAHLVGDDQGVGEVAEMEPRDADDRDRGGVRLPGGDLRFRGQFGGVVGASGDGEGFG